MTTTPMFKLEDPGGGGGRSVWSLVSEQIEKITESEDLWGHWVAVLDTAHMAPQTAASRRNSIIKTLDDEDWEVVNRTVGHDDAGKPTIRTYVRYNPMSVSHVGDDDDSTGDGDDDMTNEEWDAEDE